MSYAQKIMMAGRRFLSAVCLCAISLLLHPSVASAQKPIDDTDDTVGEIIEETLDVISVPAAHPKASKTITDPFISNGLLGHFTWGVDISSGVDLTSHDMTMTSLSACFGYKGSYFRFAGIGAEIISMMNNSSRCYPVYAMMRTSFTRNKSLCFLQAKAGITLNYLLDYKRQDNLYASLGIGFTLAHSRKFSSHAIIGAVVMPLKKVETSTGAALDYTLCYASIGIGCAF